MKRKKQQRGDEPDLSYVIFGIRLLLEICKNLLYYKSYEKDKPTKSAPMLELLR